MVDSTLYQLLILFLLFYFFLIRPEMKKAKKHQEMLDAIKKGDKVITRGGLYAKITKIENENDFLAEIADGVIVALSKTGILTVVDANEKNTAEAPKAKATSKTKTTTKNKNTKK